MPRRGRRPAMGRLPDPPAQYDPDYINHFLQSLRNTLERVAGQMGDMDEEAFTITGTQNDGDLLKRQSGAWNSVATIEAADIGSGTFADARIAQSNVTQHEGAIDHDALTNFSAAEHTDWTVDQGATNIADANLTANIPRLDQNESVVGQWTYDDKILFSDTADAANSDQAARPIIHHGTGSASAIGIDGALHTEDV